MPWLGAHSLAGASNLCVFEGWIALMFWAHVRAMCTEPAFVPRGTVCGAHVRACGVRTAF